MRIDVLLEALRLGFTAADGYQWGLCSVDDPSVVGPIARLLAERIAARRLPPETYSLWLSKRDSLRSLTATERARLLAYLDPDFGTPGENRCDDRLAAAVSEALWYEVVSKRVQPDKSPIRIEAHGFSVTDPGGDGLVVFESALGSLSFCLWEVKKHTGDSSVRDTATGAHRQLDERALSYLARFSGVHQQLSDKRLAEFYAKLVDLWQAAAESAGAGVAVSSNGPGRDVFDGLPERFPQLVPRLEGLLNSFSNYDDFCFAVRDELWKGL